MSCQQNTIDILDIESYEVLSVKEKYQEAVDLAQNWNADALLFRIDVRIVDLDPPVREGIDFIFESPTDRENLFIAYCGHSKCESEIYGLTASYINLKIDPINIKDILIDSGEAAQITLQQVGENYVEHRNFDWRITLVQSKYGNFRWNASFYNELVGRTLISIDPFTGEVLEVSK